MEFRGSGIQGLGFRGLGFRDSWSLGFGVQKLRSIIRHTPKAL